ncbi:MAG: cytochrome bc complex cytochrome b subunit [Candidatus Latescibacteria bacterium]|nr:cytochrome bc complex cytochrome b subunit [Candidatus Latescibacterota bacterium]
MSKLEERLPLAPLKEAALHKQVPIHKHAFWYYMGGISLFFFLVQMVTGVLLLFHYQPGAETAHASALRIMTKVDFGWLIRSIHSWSANLMVGAIFVHMFSVFFMKAYQKPRDLTWYTGLALLGMTFLFGFTGYLLPWDDIAFFATKVGVDVAAGTPVIGKEIANILRGGTDITGLTIQRFFALHAVVLPGIFIAILSLHLLLVQIHGNKIPEGVERANAYRTIPFFPNFLYADLYVWLLAFNVLSILAAIYPWPLGPEADILKPAPQGIHPEWYFMAQFQLLKMMPEPVAMTLFGAAGALWAIVPLWNPATATGRRGKLATYAGIAAAIGLIGLTILAYGKL